MAISAALVKELRDKTNAGMMDCKKALEEAGGDMEKAIDVLRKKGLAAAGKKAGRVASEGSVGSYIHMGGKIGVLVEVNCETDFVARTERFQQLVKNLAMHIAAARPQYLAPEDVPADVLAREKAIYNEQAANEGKPEKFREKIIEGRLNKFYGEVCLLKQLYVKDDKKTIEEVVTAAIAEMGENIRIRRFARFELGEGLEKRQDDFATEVAKMQGQA